MPVRTSIIPASCKLLPHCPVKECTLSSERTTVYRAALRRGPPVVLPIGNRIGMPSTAHALPAAAARNEECEFSAHAHNFFAPKTTPGGSLKI